MNLPTILSTIAVLLFAVIPASAFAGCTVEEIVKMAEKGSGKKIIDEKCDSEVDDAPRCEFTRVVALAVQKKRKSAIMRECGPCERPVCVVGPGFSCSLGRDAPPGVQSLDACHCFTPRGPAMGEVLCPSR